MIRIAENHLSTRFADHRDRQRFDRALRPDRHKSGQLDGTVRCLQCRAARMAIGIGRVKLELNCGRRHEARIGPRHRLAGH